MDIDILNRQMLAMDQFGLDAMIAFSPDNVAYGAGYLVPSQRLGMRNRDFAVVSDRNGHSSLLLTSNEVDEATERSTISQLAPYDEFNGDSMAVLAQLINDHGLVGQTVGVELDALSADRWESLKRQLPGVTWKPAQAAFHHARMVKTPSEIERLRVAARIAMQAQIDVREHFRVGMTEREAYRLVVDRILELGGDNVVMIQVAAGERSLFSNPSPSDRAFRRGETVKFDVFITQDGYLSDTGRTVVIGDASAEQRKAWSSIEEVLALLHQEVRSGVTTKQLWDLFVREFDVRGMSPAIRFLGHGLGLSLHEEPFLAAHSDITLEPGMVFAVEPIYVAEQCGYHIEDILLVTENGSENLTPGYGTELAECG